MAKAMIVLVVLPLLLLSPFTVLAQDQLHTLLPTDTHPPQAAPPHYHHHSPAPAPAHSPSHSPVVHPPVHPPHHHHPPAPAPAPVHPTPTHHHYPPSPTPAPTHAPAKPPTYPHYPPTPVHPPLHPFPRSFVAVQGVVYVKSCKYAGLDTLLGATPVLGAVVKLQCNNTRYKLVQTAKTDKNGYFFLEAPKTLTTFGVHKCNVVLVSAPTGLKPSNLHGGVTGAVLRPEKPYMSQEHPFLLYTVGPLAFEPKCPY